MEKLFLLEIHHSGHFDHHNAVYVNGTVDYVENVHRDTMSIIELHSLLTELGIDHSKCKMWYKMQGGSKDTGLVLLNTDKSVIEMFDINEKNDIITIMVENDQPEVVSTDQVPVGSDTLLQVHETQENTEDETGGSEEWAHTSGVDGNDCEVGDGDGFVHIDSEDSNAPVHSSELEGHMTNDDYDYLDQGKIDDARKISVQIDSMAPNQRQMEGCVVTELDDNDSGGDDMDASRSMKLHLVEIEKPILSLGMRFTNLNTLREALKQANIVSGRDLTFLKSEKQRVLAVCKSRSCPYRIYASWSPKENCFRIKAFNSIHTCARKYVNSLVTSLWLAKIYYHWIKDDPDWKPDDLVNSVKQEFSVRISKAQAYRTRTKVFKLVEAEQNEQCTRLLDYADILKWKMPGTVVKLHPDGSPHEAPADGCKAYRRAFICFEPIKRGFLIGCRPFIGLDGFHLDGPCRGHLLNAVAMDGNDEIFPLAFAWVETESKESWTWFLTILLETIGYAEENGWTFISDHQNGLVETVAEVMPAAEHRLCARHVYKNFEKRFQGVTMSSLFWEAVSSYTIVQFDNAMAKIRNEMPHGEAAHKWLRGQHTRLWSRSSFRPFSKCDLFLNSPCDSWEKRILCTNKPIISIFESVRKLLMKRNQRKRLFLKSYDEPICPKVMSKLESLKKEASLCEVVHAGDRNFEVNYKGKTFVVDMAKNDCGCGEWDLLGVPCKHAVASILVCNEKLEDYIHEYYHRTTYMKTYAPIVMPIPDSSQWPSREYKSFDSPRYDKPSDTPTQQCEESSANVVNLNRCSICKNLGHNSRTCGKFPERTESSGKNCRKRKDQSSKVRAPSSSTIAKSITKRCKKGKMSGTSEVIPASSSTIMQGTVRERKRWSMGETSKVRTAVGSTISQPELPRRTVLRGKRITRTSLRRFRCNPSTSSNADDPIIID